MFDDVPYSEDELRRVRRLIRAAGLDVAEWCGKLRRSADFLQSLSPIQAERVAQQANAIARHPADFGTDMGDDAESAEVLAVPEEERQKYISRQIIELRRVHYPGPLEDE